MNRRHACWAKSTLSYTKRTECLGSPEALSGTVAVRARGACAKRDLADCLPGQRIW
jgi:hypothetical protein